MWDNFWEKSFHQNVEQVEENADSADDDRERTMHRIVRILMWMIRMRMTFKMRMTLMMIAMDADW